MSWQAKVNGSLKRGVAPGASSGLGGWMGWASQEVNGLPSSALMPRRISP